MKNMDEFRAEVYARAEREINKRKSKQALMRRYSSLAAMLVIVFAAVLAVANLAPSIKETKAMETATKSDSEISGNSNDTEIIDGTTTEALSVETTAAETCVTTTRPNAQTTTLVISPTTTAVATYTTSTTLAATYYQTTVATTLAATTSISDEMVSAITGYEGGVCSYTFCYDAEQCASPYETEEGIVLAESQDDLQARLSYYKIDPLSIGSRFDDEYFKVNKLAVCAIKMTADGTVGFTITETDDSGIVTSYSVEGGGDAYSGYLILLIPCGKDVQYANLKKSN